MFLAFLLWMCAGFNANAQKALPVPNNQTHVFDFARFLDNEVSPVKAEMDFFFTAFGSADSSKLAEVVAVLNVRAPKLFSVLEDLPKKAENEPLLNAYLDFARFCMNSRTTLRKWVAVSGRYQWAKRLGQPNPESTLAPYESLVNLRKGYIEKTKELLKRHNEFCAKHGAEFETYPSQRVMEIFQHLKFGSAASTAVFIDAVATLNRFESGQRYVFLLGAESLSGTSGMDQLAALKENINFALPEKSFVWQALTDKQNPEHKIEVLYSARYAKPSAPLLVIRYNPQAAETATQMQMEVYSKVPSFLGPAAE
jgi:hypothetical protein